MNPWFSALLVAALFLFVTLVSRHHSEALDPMLYQYVVENFEEDCGTTNAVTAILLDYRMYDTMFEVLILLTAIIGMKQFLPTRREYGGAVQSVTARPQESIPPAHADATSEPPPKPTPEGS